MSTFSRWLRPIVSHCQMLRVRPWHLWQYRFLSSNWPNGIGLGLSSSLLPKYPNIRPRSGILKTSHYLVMPIRQNCAVGKLGCGYPRGLQSGVPWPHLTILRSYFSSSVFAFTFFSTLLVQLWSLILLDSWRGFTVSTLGLAMTNYETSISNPVLLRTWTECDLFHGIALLSSVLAEYHKRRMIYNNLPPCAHPLSVLRSFPELALCLRRVLIVMIEVNNVSPNAVCLTWCTEVFSHIGQRKRLSYWI